MATTSTDRRYGVSSGLAFKAPCKAATTANITLSGEQTIDGVALVTGDRCLVKNQTTGVENGIYVVDTSAWELDRDWDGTRDVKKGTSVRVTDGTVNQGYWYVTTSDPITPGTTSVAFSRTVNSSEVPGVATITALKAINHAGLIANDKVTVVEAGRAGDFYWVTGDQSANVTADTQSGIWVAPDSAPTGASGAWKRVYTGALRPEWFGTDGTRAGDSVAIRAAFTVAAGEPVLFSEKRYYYDAAVISTSPVRAWGSGMPRVNAGLTALEDGTIIDGSFRFSGADVEIRDLGVDVGSASACAEGDGLKCTTTLNAGRHLHTENVIALLKSKTSAYHSLLFESYLKHTGGNLLGIYGYFGCVIKNQRVQLSTIETREQNESGTYLKSDATFGTCGDVQIGQIKSSGATEFGLRVISDGATLRRVQIGSVLADGSKKGVQIAALTLNGVDVRDVKIGSITSKGAATADLSVESLNAAGGILNVSVGELTTVDTVLRGIYTVGPGSLANLHVGRAFINYVSTATDLTMEGAVEIGTVVDGSVIEDITIIRNYSTATVGAINYGNTASKNILGHHRARVFGTGAPRQGFSIQAISGVTATITVPENYSGESKSLVTAQPAAGTIITVFANPHASTVFSYGHYLTIINDSANVLQINNGFGGLILNKGGDNIVLAANDTASWIWGGSAWHQVDNLAYLQGSATWDPGNLVDGAGETSASVTVTGAALGDFAIASAPYDLQGITCNAYVDAANSVKIRLQNETGGAIDLASGTWRVKAIKQ